MTEFIAQIEKMAEVEGDPTDDTFLAHILSQVMSPTVTDSGEGTLMSHRLYPGQEFGPA